MREFICSNCGKKINMAHGEGGPGKGTKCPDCKGDLQRVGCKGQKANPSGTRQCKGQNVNSGRGRKGNCQGAGQNGGGLGGSI